MAKKWEIYATFVFEHSENAYTLNMTHLTVFTCEFQVRDRMGLLLMELTTRVSIQFMRM